MENQNDRSGWYSTSDEREWFRQYSPRLTAELPEPKKKKPHPGMKAVILSVCVLILLVATALAFHTPADMPELWDGSEPPSGDDGGFEADSGFPEDFRSFFESYYTKDESMLPSTIEAAPLAPERSIELVSSDGLEELSLQELYERCAPSVVSISAWDSGMDDGYYWGSGVIMSEDGYILTNAHVISGTSFASVMTVDGTEYDARLVGEDIQGDLAILKIDAEGLIPAEFGMSDELRVGDSVAAIGNPVSPELTRTLTSGIVSAMDRDVFFNGHMMAFIQTDAAINEGSSGGPLLNMYGQVVGITNMKFSAELYETSIEGIGFAIPASTVKLISDQLYARGSVSGRPGIGITAGSVPDTASRKYDLPEGVYITQVNTDSDAYAKGLRPGDIITEVNGEPVMSVDDINIIKDGYSIGDTLEMTVFRNGKTFLVEIELMDMSELS